MSNEKKTMMDFFPPMPNWGWNGCMDEQKKQWEDFKSNMESFWNQMMEMQKTSMETWKERRDKAFPQFLEMQDKFASSLPKELPALPGMPSCSMSPKDFMDKVKEFQEMANKHAVEQADSFFDFLMQGQHKAKEMVLDAVESIEDSMKKNAD